MNKRLVNISDVLFFQEGPGVRNTQYTTEGVKLLNVANLVDGRVDLSTSDRYISEEEAYGKYKHFLCDAGDFIVASSGIKVEYIDKKMGFINESMLPLCMNTSTIRFKTLDPNQLRIRFFMYYLKSQHFKEQLSKHITGSAQLNYGPSHLKKMVMPMFPITVQDRLIDRLDKIHGIIDLRQQELQKLDDLIKARFVEMFGTVQNNVFGFDDGTLESVSDEFFAGGDKPADCANKKDHGHPYPVFANGYEGEGLQGYSAKCRVNKPAVTVSARGTIGYCFIREAGFTPVVRLVTIVPNNRVSVVFLKYAIDTMDIKSSGTSQAQLTVPDFKREKIIVPPIDLQDQFAAFVSQVDKSKEVVQKALNKAQLLFDSLLQMYFG